MGQYSDLELLIIEKFTEAIGDIIDEKESSQWNKDKLMFAACINEEEKDKTTRKVIKKLQKKLTKCSPDIAEFLRCYINPSENDLKVSSGYGFRFNIIRNFLFQEFNDVLEVLTVKFKNIEAIEGIDYLDWQESIEEGHYGIDNKFIFHFINYMAIAARLVTFKSFIDSDTKKDYNQLSVLNKLFSYFEKTNELDETKNLEFQDHFNRYGNDNFIEIELKYDIEIEPWQKNILIEINNLHKNSVKLNYFFFDCPFEVYKKHFKNRKEEFFNKNIDANELDFLISEVSYFSNPKNNRYFKDGEKKYLYHGYFKNEETYVITLRRKLEYLNFKLKEYNLKINLSGLKKSEIDFKKIKIFKIENNSSKNSMIKDSTWDYPLSNDYNWYKLILNSFKTKTDRDYPEDYFKTEFLKRNDVYTEKRFYSLCLEYLNKLIIEFKKLVELEFVLKYDTSDLSKQILNSSYFLELENNNLNFNNTTEVISKNILKAFQKAIYSLEIHLKTLNTVIVGKDKMDSILSQYTKAFCAAISNQNLIMENGFLTTFKCDITHYTDFFKNEINENLLRLKLPQRDDYLLYLIHKIESTPFYNTASNQIDKYIFKYNIEVDTFPENIDEDLYNLLNSYPKRLDLSPEKQSEITQTQLLFYTYFAMLEAKKMTEFVKLKKKTKLNSKKESIKLKNKFKIKHQSFTYINNIKGQSNLTALKDSLIRKKLIDKNTELKDFRKVFSGEDIKNPIVWTGNISELSYFIKQLHNVLKLVENLRQQQWVVTINCFIRKNGEKYNRVKLRTQKIPSTSKKIDSALNTLK